tara:strand:- start:953 stop:1357 length:405 start_codon:yes stop_codon:yes gene_type:complete
MIGSIIGAVAGPLVKGLFGIIDQAVEDKDLAAKIKAEIAARQQELIQTELRGAIEIILAEARGGWLQRNWRPMLMVAVMAIIVNNYILFPYLSLWTDKVVVLELPGGLWALLTTGVGGYVVGRSGEKIAERLAK